jgi:hypothetical protein
MDFQTLLTWNGTLYYDQITELEDGTLRIKVKFLRNEKEKIKSINTSSISPNDELSIFQLDFPTIVSYLVVDEAYTSLQDSEVFDGEIFRVYKKSRYLDFIQTQTYALEIEPQKSYTHYQIPSMDYVIDVVSFVEPIITQIDD